MSRETLEGLLAKLREEWPARSVVADVLERIEARETARAARPGRGRRVAVALAATFLAAVVIPWALIGGSPATVLAQVERALDGAQTAHIRMSLLAGEARTTSEIWYRRGEGFRFSDGREVIIGDGHQQYSWRVATGGSEGVAGGPPLVVRQPGGDAARSIGQMLDLSGIPSTRDCRRVPELDRTVDGEPYTAFESIARDQDRDRAVPRADSAWRAIVSVDRDDRVREFVEQKRERDGWVTVRTIAISYDETPTGRLDLDLPPGAKVVEAGALAEVRFPVDRAVATAELGGLSFAIHEVVPVAVESGGYLVVSSVRGTSEFLRDYPPRRRTVNLGMVAFDVADQQGAPSPGEGFRRIVLARSERDGVQYLWWLIVPRRFFRVEEGRRVEMNLAHPGELSTLQAGTGKIRLPIGAAYRHRLKIGPSGLADVIGTWVELDDPAGEGPVATFAEIAARVRADLLLLGMASDAALLGGAIGSPLGPRHPVDPERITDAAYASEIIDLIERARAWDRLGGR